MGLYGTGYLVGHQNLSFANGVVPQITNRDLGRPDGVDFSLFWRTYDLLKQKYIGAIDPQQFVYGAIRGAVDSLKDPYTVFMDPNDAKDFSDSLNGEFDGVGIEIAIKDNKITVVAPLDGSPAKAAGVRAGDVITKIDDTSTEGMPLGDAVARIRGKSGTTVRISVLHQGQAAPVELSMKRATVTIDPVKWELKDGNVGVITITEFGDKTVDLTKKALATLSKQGADRYIIDLRDDPGGFLDSAIDVASMFVKDGVVVIEEDKDGAKTSHSVNGHPIAPNAKLVVLQNDGSASASEILAGALQDHHRATVVGVKSFGKGSVQEFENFPDQSSLKVTVAHWLTPNGNTINEKGITPDVTVQLSDEDRKAGKDPQMDKALELVKQ